MPWHCKADTRRARVFPTEEEARTFGEILVSRRRVESFEVVELAVEPDVEWRSDGGTRFLPVRKLPSYEGHELVYGVVDNTLLFTMRPDVAANTRFLSALLAARTWYQLRCLVTPGQLDWVVGRFERQREKEIEEAECLEILDAEFSLGGALAKHAQVGPELEVPPRGDAPFDFYDLPGVKDGSIFVALTALPAPPIPDDLRARYGFGSKVTGFGCSTGDRSHVGFDPSVETHLLRELDRIGFCCVHDDALISEAVWGPDEVGLKRERERIRDQQRENEIGETCTELGRELDDVVHAYLRRIEEEAERRGDTPQISLMRTFERLELQVDEYRGFLREHHSQDDDAVDIDAWVSELVRESASFWTRVRACGAFAQRMLCVSTGSAYALWEPESD